MSAGFRLPSRYGPALFGGLLSGSMSLLVSGVATWRAIGFSPEFVRVWINAWLTAWPVAFAAVMVVAPAVRRLVAAMVEPPAAAPTSHAAVRSEG